MRSQEFYRQVFRLTGTFFACLIVGYFIYHSIWSDHGILTLQEIDHEILLIEADLADVAAQRTYLENRLALLHPESLDPDMIEEQGRRLLNYTHPHDILILLPEN